ncbi:hypothetical protein [Winogradskyella aurantiaca]|uniref:hypothetical protein n=1 Tax=Winogradskyella aurantiaca TaxID=2219558 RepID=UPI000E1D8A25|nr:hypothetical protein [Winogradskyella aurantiaca]
MSASHTMNVVLRNNALLLKKRSKRKWTLVSNSKRSAKGYNLPKASSKTLRDIRKKMKTENQIRSAKVFALTAIIFLVLMCFVLTQLKAI